MPDKTCATRNGNPGVGASAWIALALGCLCYIFTMYLRACPAILSGDLQLDFGVDAAGITVFSSATLVGYGIMQMPAGLLTDAIGGRKTLVVFMLLAAGATLAFALAPSLGIGTGARFATGLALAAVPPLGAVLAHYFPRERYTQGMGILMASGGLGSILASEPLARLSVGIGWRGAMIASAVVVCALGVAVFFVLRDGSKSAAAQGAAPSAVEQLRAIGRGMKRIFRSGQYWYLAIWQIASSIVFFSFMSMWAGPYLMECCGLDKITASRVMMAQGLGAIILVPMISSLADKLNSRRAGLVICASFGLAGSLALSLFSGSLPVPVLAVCIMSMPLCGLAGATCVFSLIRRNFPIELTGTGIGCANMLWPVCAALLNSVIGVTLGYFSDGVPADMMPRAALAAAYGKTFGIYVGCYALALILPLFFIKENFSIERT